KHPLYQRLCYESFLHTALVNDIIFLKKKINDEQIDNLVLIICKEHFLQESIKNVLKKINELIIEIRKTTAMLSIDFFYDHNFNTFIKIFEFIVDANVRWHIQIFDNFNCENISFHNKQLTFIELDNSLSINQEKMPAVEKRLLEDKSNSIKNGFEYLERTCSLMSGFQSQIGKSRELVNSISNKHLEIYSSSIILDLLNETQTNPKLLYSLQIFLVDDECNLESFNFFKQKGIIQDDVDATALCALALFGIEVLGQKDIEAIAKRILRNTNEKGIIQTYFPPRGERENRIDPTVCASAIRLIYKVGYDEAAKETENYLYCTLATKSYLNGSKYFHSPDAFLYYLYKAIILSKFAFKKFGALLAANVIDRLGTTNYPLDLAMRILIVEGLGLLKHVHMPEIISKEKKSLEILQEEDGSWPKDALYKTGRSEIYFGGKEISTAFSIKALQIMQQADLTPHKPFLCDMCQIIRDKKEWGTCFNRFKMQDALRNQYALLRGKVSDYKKGAPNHLYLRRSTSTARWTEHLNHFNLSEIPNGDLT
ncbi:4243_t:CDS:2, partial [Scutellospora calospora]